MDHCFFICRAPQGTSLTAQYVASYTVMCNHLLCLVFTLIYIDVHSCAFIHSRVSAGAFVQMLPPLQDFLQLR